MFRNLFSKRKSASSPTPHGATATVSASPAAESPVASSFVRRIDGAMESEDVRWDSVRLSVVRKIDEKAEAIADASQREQFRRDSQREWNVLHPDAAILEWSRDDPAYERDTETAVIVSPRPGRQNCSYGVFEKATGKDCTDEIYHEHFLARKVERELREFEGVLDARNFDELAEIRFEAFQGWLAVKRAQSTAYKYNKGADGFDVRGHHVVYEEFLEETGYENPTLPLKATPEEKERLENLREAAAQAQGRIQGVKDRYGLVDVDLLDMEDQYCDDSEPGCPQCDPITGELWYD